MRKSFTALTMAFAVALAGCGDGGTGLTGDRLSEDESAALAAAVVDVAISEGIATAFGGGPAAAPVDISQSVEATPACALGGTINLQIDLDGTVDDETGAIDISMSMTATPQSCGVTSEGYNFVLDGDPSINLSMDMTGSQSGAFNFDGNYSGGVEWELDGASGTCTLDVTFSATQSGGSVSGSVCGQSVDESFSG